MNILSGGTTKTRLPVDCLLGSTERALYLVGLFFISLASIDIESAIIRALFLAPKGFGAKIRRIQRGMIVPGKPLG